MRKEAGFDTRAGCGDLERASMGQVSITLNGRTYRLRCGEGEEPRLIELADVVRGKLQGLIHEFGQAGDDRLLLMSALLIADELLDARARLAALSAQQVPVQAQPPQPHQPTSQLLPQQQTGPMITAPPGPPPPPRPAATRRA